MSLKFLSKKSWHTTNLDNVEKVWLQEQKKAEEQKKLSELQKQIQDEKAVQELRQLQVASGQTVKTVDMTLDWMYEGPSAAQNQTTEEYLLGKIYNPGEAKDTDVHKLSKDPGSLWLNKISSKNDTFTRINEDPLMVMKKNEKLSRENVLNNPVKMARIKHAIAQELEQKESERRARKAAKREKKEMKKERKRSRSSDSSGSKRGRSGKETRYSEVYKDEYRDNGKEGSTRMGSSRDEIILIPRRRREPSPFGERRAGGRSRSRSTDRSVGHEERGRERRRSSDHDFGDRREGRKSDDRRYGLQSNLESSSRRQSDYVGPNPELITRKAEKEAKELAEKKKPRDTAKGLSEDEKAKRLLEMRAAAEVHDALRTTRTRPDAKDLSKEESSKHAGKDAGFLQSMRSEVYSGKGELSSVEDRLKQNRHYVQKNEDLDSHGFMKR